MKFPNIKGLIGSGSEENEQTILTSKRNLQTSQLSSFCNNFLRKLNQKPTKNLSTNGPQRSPKKGKDYVGIPEPEAISWLEIKDSQQLELPLGCLRKIVNGQQMGYNPNRPHLWVGYDPLTNLLLTSWNIQAGGGLPPPSSLRWRWLDFLHHGFSRCMDPYWKQGNLPMSFVSFQGCRCKDHAPLLFLNSQKVGFCSAWAVCGTSRPVWHKTAATCLCSDMWAVKKELVGFAVSRGWNATQLFWGL